MNSKQRKTMNTMTYGGYVTNLEYDEAADLFHGEVIN